MTNTNESQLTERGLQRRLKRYLHGTDQTFFATTTPGFEKTLESEIRELLPDTLIKETFSGGVEFTAAFETLYFANIVLRCANRIVMRIETFTARSYPELYNKCKRIQWELYCGFTDKVSFSVSSKHSRLHHSGNIEQAVTDALTEYMKSLGVKVDRVVNSAICFQVRFDNDSCTISIDTSGDLLYKRGYRINTAHAPIRETIAAAILREMKADEFPCIADPMCGSGTFLIEAAMLNMHITPGLNRQFAFQKWPSFSETHFTIAQKKVAAATLTTSPIRLYGSDIDQKAISATSENFGRLELQDILTLSVDNCLNINKDGSLGKHGLILANLPYGKRVDAEAESIEQLIRQFGKHLKQFCKGWHFAFISAHEQFPRWSGLHITKKFSFDNGGIPVAVFMGTI